MKRMDSENLQKFKKINPIQALKFRLECHKLDLSPYVYILEEGQVAGKSNIDTGFCETGYCYKEVRLIGVCHVTETFIVQIKRSYTPVSVQDIYTDNQSYFEAIIDGELKNVK
jgi:hypothetical protein